MYYVLYIDRAIDSKATDVVQLTSLENTHRTQMGIQAACISAHLCGALALASEWSVVGAAPCDGRRGVQGRVRPQPGEGEQV